MVKATAIAVSGIWENNNTMVGGMMTQKQMHRWPLRNKKKNFGNPHMGYGQNIDEERKMRLNLQVMVGLKEGSRAYGKITTWAPNGNLGAN
jgi:hypothetical protein